MTAAVPVPVEQNPATVPLYTPWDVARYFHIPVWSVLLMTGRVRDWPHPEWLFRHYRRMVQFSPDDDPQHPPWLQSSGRLSFAQTADLFVLSAAFHLLDAVPTTNDDADRLGHALWRGLEGAARHPIIQAENPTEQSIERVASRFPVTEAESAFLRKWFSLHLHRVEIKETEAIRIYPFSRDPAEGSPRTVVLDPRIRFGRPTLVGRGLPTDSVIDRYRAGDSVADLAADYDVTTNEIEEAIRYESLPAFQFIPWIDW